MTQQIPTDRYDLLEWLNGRYITVTIHRSIGGVVYADRLWQKVEWQSVRGQYGVINLALYEQGQLEELARESIGQKQYERWYCDQQIAYQRVAEGRDVQD